MFIGEANPKAYPIWSCFLNLIHFPIMSMSNENELNATYLKDKYHTFLNIYFIASSHLKSRHGMKNTIKEWTKSMGQKRKKPMAISDIHKFYKEKSCNNS